MHHDRRAHTGAEIGRAGCKIAELRVKGYIQNARYGVIDSAAYTQCVFNVKSAFYDLYPYVIFLTYHYADRTILGQKQYSAFVGRRELRTYKVLFDHRIYLDLAYIVHIYALIFSAGERSSSHSPCYAFIDASFSAHFKT